MTLAYILQYIVGGVLIMTSNWSTGHVSYECCMKVFSLILTDISLTLSNLTSALDSLPDKLWWDFGWYMDVPGSIRNKIKSQLSSDKEMKAELLRVISTEHPHLTWEHVSDVLYQLEDEECHHVLEKVQSRFPTGEHLSHLLFLHLPTFALYISFVNTCMQHTLVMQY